MKRLETLGYLGPNRRADVTVSELVLQPSLDEEESLDTITEQLVTELPVCLEQWGLDPDWSEWSELLEQTSGPERFQHLLAFTALTLQRQAGHVVSHRAAITEIDPEGQTRYRAIWEHDDPHCGELSGDLGLCMLAEAAPALAWDSSHFHESGSIPEALGQFLAHARTQATLPETLALIRVARHRDIPVLRLEREPYPAMEAPFRVSPNGMLRLGQCCHQLLLDGTFPVQREGPGFALMSDRRTMWRFLASQGAPVNIGEPDALACDGLERATIIADRIGFPLRIWPRARDPRGGMGWRVNHPGELSQWFDEREAEVPPVLLEPEVEGRTLDVLVTGRQFIHASLDGRQVVPDQNLTQFAFRASDAVNTGMLRLVFRLTEQAPGIRLVHLDAAPPFTTMLQGDRSLIDQAVGEYLDWLLMPGTTHSVPITAITGTNGKTTTSTMIAEAWRAAGYRVGLAQTEGIWFDGQEVEHGDLAGFLGHCKVIENPEMEVAVLETARGGVARFGFAWPRCDVAVMTNVSGDHLGLQGIETTDQLAVLKRSVLERADKAVVLNIDNAYCRDMIPHLPRLNAGTRLCVVSMEQSSEQAQEAAGRDCACCVLETIEDEEWIIHHDGDTRSAIAPTSAIPSTRGGAIRFNVFNAMAAAAAALHGGVPLKAIQQSLESFNCRPDNVPGRMNHYGGLPYQLILDHGHNADAMENLVDYVDRIECKGQRIVLLPGMFNRQDENLSELVLTLAGHFDHYILSNYRTTEPQDHERVPHLFRNTLLKHGIREDQITVVLEEWDSIKHTLSLGKPGDLLLLQVGHDVFPEMQPMLKQMGAHPI